jgi:hypothetical protein
MTTPNDTAETDVVACFLTGKRPADLLSSRLTNDGGLRVVVAPGPLHVFTPLEVAAARARLAAAAADPAPHNAGRGNGEPAGLAAVDAPAAGSDAASRIGQPATCLKCGKPIFFNGLHWQHKGKRQPRHPAVPTEA